MTACSCHIQLCWGAYCSNLGHDNTRHDSWPWSLIPDPRCSHHLLCILSQALPSEPECCSTVLLPLHHPASQLMAPSHDFTWASRGCNSLKLLVLCAGLRGCGRQHTSFSSGSSSGDPSPGTPPRRATSLRAGSCQAASFLTRSVLLLATRLCGTGSSTLPAT